MLKRAISLLLLLVCFLNLSSCSPSRTKQVKDLKAQFPEVKLFVDENSEFLQTLICIKDRIREFNELQAEQWCGFTIQSLPEELLPINHYYIHVVENRVAFEALWYKPSPEEELSLITGEERVLVGETLLEISHELRSINIYPDSISISYGSSVNTGLALVNPVLEIEDPGYYGGRSIIVFTEPVNDDWCIKIMNYT